MTGHIIFALAKRDVCLLGSFPYDDLPLPFTIKLIAKEHEETNKMAGAELDGGIFKQ